MVALLLMYWQKGLKVSESIKDAERDRSRTSTEELGVSVVVCTKVSAVRGGCRRRVR
jgi:hypothetical protein